MIKDGHISPMQLISLFFILIVGKEMNSSILILIHAGHNAAELLLMISQMIMVIVIACMLPLCKDPSKNLFDHFFDYFGPIVGFVFSLIMFVALMLDLSINVTFDLEQIRSIFLPTTPIALIVFILVLSMIIPVYYGIEVLGRTSLFMLYFIGVTILFTIVFSLSNANLNNIPPVFGPGMGALLKQGIVHVGFFGELIAYLMMRPYLRSYSSFKRSFYFVSGSTLIIGVLQVLSVQFVFPYPSNDQLFFPLIEMAKLIYFGRFIQHVESIYAVAWLVAMCVRLSFMMYVLSVAAASMVRATNYRRFVPSIAALVFYIALLPSTLSDAIDFKDVVLEQRLPFLYGTILILFIIVGYFKLWRNKRADTKKAKLQSA
ncbi:GerAB/ArcD/ProY family transporter [Sulfoacidibacillus ferrooxidans]|uniref:Uncharacterized protein n=1 Tax=Sulfoacidibacillus ferrooxidans TaxID=2005001 RepID=A0A9X1VEJ3_9BACL|nr:endospore germination permease [Sulfoacidibacillus ferrooxidans]MCI0184567.1 hypothetical protein [Sulfoacidibacillus ferrooxidans]